MVDYGKSKGSSSRSKRAAGGWRTAAARRTGRTGSGRRGRRGRAAPAAAARNRSAPALPRRTLLRRPRRAPPRLARLRHPPARRRLTGPPAWALLAEIIKGAGAYSNVDVGGANAANQEELHSCLKMMFPMTADTMHTRVNTRWDLATAIKYLEGELGYKGLYTIEAGNGHEGTQPIYDVVVATLDAKT